MPKWLPRAIVSCALIPGAPLSFAQGILPAWGAPGREAANLRSMGLADAIRLGANEGPGVVAARASSSAVEQTRRAADVFLPLLPRATVAVGQRVGPIEGIEVAATAMQDISLGGLGSARRQTASALARLSRADIGGAKLEAAARAGRAWISAWEADRIIDLRQQGLDQAMALARTAATRVGTGVAEPLERALAEGEVAAARAASTEAEGLRFEAEIELEFATGTVGTPLEATGDLADTAAPPVDERALARSALRDHPAVQVAEARAEVALREGELSAATIAPTLGLGFSFVREGTGDRIFSGVVSVPLPLGNPAGFDAARGRAAAAAANAQAGWVRGEVLRALRLALHEQEHRREVRDTLTGLALKPMREAVRLAKAQFDAGTLDVTHVLIARQRLRTVEEQIIRARADVGRADIEVARAAASMPPEAAR